MKPRSIFPASIILAGTLGTAAAQPAPAPAAQAVPATAAAAPAAEAPIMRTFDDATLAWQPCPPFMPAGCGLAVLHGDPAKPNADVFFKVPAGSTIPRHWHSSAERMALVSGAMTVTYEGQAPIELRTGAYAYGPAKLPHSAVCATGAPCVLFIAFEGPIDVLSNESGAE